MEKGERKEGSDAVQKEKKRTEKKRKPPVVGFKGTAKEPGAKEREQPLEAKKGKNMGSPQSF